LVSVIGSTFEKVQEEKSNLMYQDLVGLIVENQFLIGDKA